MRATAGLNSDDPLDRQNLAAREELGIFVGVNIIGDHCEVDLGPELLQSISTRAVLPEPTGPATPSV